MSAVRKSTKSAKSATAATRSAGRTRGPRRPRDRRPPWPLFFVAIVVVVALVAAGTIFSVRIVQAEHQLAVEQARREAVLRAARQASINFTTIGYKTVDKDIARVVALATGDFKRSYKKNRKTVEETVKKNKSTSKGQVLGAGLVSVDNDSAVALVVVDSRVTNIAYEKPTLRHYRMRLTLVKDKGKWLVSDLAFVA